MAYIFAILNSLQGFFIFVFHCVQNEKVRQRRWVLLKTKCTARSVRFRVSNCLFVSQVRKEYPRFIRKHSWLPKCLRCSKPNAAGGSSSGGGGSSGVGKEGRTSLYPGSNGNPSAPPDSSVLSQHGTSVGTNNIVSNNLNNVRPAVQSVQFLPRTELNNASTTTMNHNRLHNIAQQGTRPRVYASNNFVGRIASS